MTETVVNADGQADYDAEYNPGWEWIDLWAAYKGKPPSQMNRLGCQNPDCKHRPITEDNPLVGAHVKRKRGYSPIWVMPLCRGCNSEKDNLEAFDVDEGWLVKESDLIELASQI